MYNRFGKMDDRQACHGTNGWCIANYRAGEAIVHVRGLMRYVINVVENNYLQ